MSATIIHLLMKNGEQHEIPFKNAWCGGMHVWTTAAELYGHSHFPITSGDDGEMRRIWNLVGVKAPDYLRIVMLTTMDGLLLEPSRIQECIDAMIEYDENHPGSHIGMQAELLKTIVAEPDNRLSDIAAIGWNQNSIVGSHWDGFDVTELVDDPSDDHDFAWVMQSFDEVKGKLDENGVLHEKGD